VLVLDADRHDLVTAERVFVTGAYPCEEDFAAIVDGTALS
jgi:hypothetical protein